jgi:hypothetical protein
MGYIGQRLSLFKNYVGFVIGIILVKDYHYFW